MERSTPKRRLNLTGLTPNSGPRLSNSRTPISKFHVIVDKTASNVQNERKDNSHVPEESCTPTTTLRSSEAPRVQRVTVVPMSKLVVGPHKAIVTTTASSSPSVNSSRKFRYATIGMNNLKRPALHPEISVTTNVATQTAPSFLRDNCSKQENLNKTDLFAVCRWCGSLSKDFTNCERCKRAMDENPKTYTPPPLYIRPLQGTNTPQTITTIISHPIVLTPQQAVALLPTPTTIGSKNFYGQQIALQTPINHTYLSQIQNGSSKILVLEKQTQPAKKGRKKKAEPECLTISSDEEENMDDSTNKEMEANSSQNSSMTTNLPISETTERTPDCSSSLKRATVIQVTAKKDLQDSPESPNSSNSSSCGSAPSATNGSLNMDEIHLKCRSIRIGSYKVQAHENQLLLVKVTCTEIQFHVGNLLGDKLVEVSLQRNDIPSVLAHFGKALPVLFIYTTPVCGGNIRSLLNMSIKDKIYFDPCHSNESMKRITILPVNLSDHQRNFLLTKFPADLIQEIRQSVANEVLVKSTPTFNGPQKIGYSNYAIETRSQLLLQTQQQTKSKDIVKLVTYPAPPQTGGIEINSEDLECLNEGEFLNDVIIDFYLKYLINERLSPEDRKRTHIFSSFFFPRLIMKNPDEDVSINIVRRRHNRVKTWTRHVDIFEKDFVVVPINQSSHWFLAVICFPGMVQSGSSTAAKLPNEVTKEPEGEECEPPGMSNMPPPSDDCMMDSPLAFDNPESMETEDQECPFPPTPPACPLLVPIPGGDSTPQTKVLATPTEPCILVFDSLPGNSRWKIVRTLREYLSMEFESKKKSICEFDRTTMKGFNVLHLPRQDNYSDCGIFLLQYVESFFENPLKHFTFPLPDLSKWFEESKITGKREELIKLILSLQQQQQDSAKDKTKSTNAPKELSASTTTEVAISNNQLNKTV